MRWRQARFRAVGSCPRRASSVTHGMPRAFMSVRTIVAQRPGLHVRGAQLRVEHDLRAPASTRRIPSSMSSIIGVRYSVGVEAAAVVEGVAADGAEARPERVGGARRSLVHVVVEQVAEVGDDAVDRRRVVVGAEDPGQLRVGRRRLARMRWKTSGCTATSASTNTRMSPDAEQRARVAGRRRARVPRDLDHDDLLGAVMGGLDRFAACRRACPARSVAGTIAVRRRASKRPATLAQDAVTRSGENPAHRLPPVRG